MTPFLRKEKYMKNAITIVVTLALAAVSGCYPNSQSQKGGSTLKGEDFRISVPYFDTKVKQGEVQTVTISLKRGDYFKQDVELQIEAAKGISVEPTKVLVEASETPDVQIRISAAQDAALGEYRVSVKGTPTTGEPTSVKFNVKVVSP
jgi:uncharacterized membrane protein